MDLEHCLLLIRAPSDRAIYEAFRSMAARKPAPLTDEFLSIEGGIPLTSELSAPATPGTLERLLEADCDMIDKLQLRFGSLQITYVRSGGHPPYRESYFDEIHLEAGSDAELDKTEVAAVIKVLFETLSIASHSDTQFFSDLIAGIVSDRAHSSESPARERALRGQQLT